MARNVAETHRVWCGGKRHRIVVTTSGRIATLHHEIDAELAAAKLAGSDVEVPRCVDIVRKLRRGAWNELPLWAQRMRRIDRNGRCPRLIVNKTLGLRWLAERWFAELYPPINPYIRPERVIVEWDDVPLADDLISEGGPKYLMVFLNKDCLLAALKAKLPSIPGCAILGVDGGWVHYAEACHLGLVDIFSDKKGAWVRRAHARNRKR